VIRFDRLHHLAGGVKACKSLHDFAFQHEAELFAFLHVVKADQNIARRFRAISSYPRLTVLLAVHAKDAVTSAPR
jgi:hypothetical protein